MGLFDVFGQILKQVKNKNEADEAVETAEPVIFEQVRKRVEEVEQQESTSRGRGDIYKDFAEKVKQAQHENEVDPEVKTADRSVYDDLLNEIEKLKKQVEDNPPERRVDNTPPQRRVAEPVFIPRVESQPQPQFSNYAMTASGGSLQLRSQPSMGAAKLDIFIKNQSQVRILSMSENAIILDGKRSRFVEVEYNGQRGWVLESYLIMGR